MTKKYEPYFLAFIDVLGFKQKVLNSQRNDKNTNDFLTSYINCSLDIVNNLNTNLSKQNIGLVAKVISDSIIIYVKDSIENNKEEFKQLCIAVGRVQLALASKSFFTRGAISHGKLHIDYNSELIVGEALINAYELEVNQAKHPRVIVDPRTIYRVYNDFEDAKTSLSGANKPWQDHTSIICFAKDVPTLFETNYEKDGIPFINFIVSEKINTSVNLKAISKAIIKELNSTPENFKKINWLKLYLLEQLYYLSDICKNLKNQIKHDIKVIQDEIKRS